MLRFALPLALLLSAAPFPQSQAASHSQDAPPPQPPQQLPETQAPPPVPEQVAAAEAAIVKADWTAARTALDAYLDGNPHDARALFDAGYVADAQSRDADAEDLYRRALNADPKPFQTHLSLGLLLAREGKLDDARPELALSTTLDPGDLGAAAKARAWRALAAIDSKQNPGEASNDLLQALKLTPETPADTRMAASLAEAAGNLDWAAAAYRRMLAADPASQPANAGLAHILIAGGHYPEAETVLRTALEITPDDPTLNAQLAAVLVAEDKAEALPVVEKLHSAHPEDQAITRMLAKILAASGDPVESDKLYLQLLKTAPDDPVLLVGHGQNLIHQLQFAAAQTAFEKAAAIDPASGEAWSGLAFAASRNQHPEITLHALTERSKLLPEVPSSYFLWATAYDTLHQRGQAAAYYHHFLEAAKGKFPDQEWQARQRLKLLER